MSRSDPDAAPSPTARGRWRSVLAEDAGRTPLLLLAIVLLLLPAVLDVEPIGIAAAPFTNTIAAVFAVVGVLVTARLVNRWTMLREQDDAIVRFRGLSRIAFRSLSQTVNDVGRMLLAPVHGIDLRVLGVPGVDRQDVDDYLSPILRAGGSPHGGMVTGFWREDDEGALRERPETLMREEGFPAQMFLMTARARRRLQDTLADWAPVMVTVPGAASELDAGWGLSDALVRSAERWRLLALEGTAASEADRLASADDYLDAVRHYRVWLEDLQARADLPTKGYTSQRAGDTGGL